MQKIFIISFLFFLQICKVEAAPDYSKFVNFLSFPDKSEKFFLQLQNEIQLSYEEQSNLQELLIEVSYEFSEKKNKLNTLSPEIISKIIDNKVAKILTPKNYVAYLGVKNKIIGD